MAQSHTAMNVKSLAWGAITQSTIVLIVIIVPLYPLFALSYCYWPLGLNTCEPSEWGVQVDLS